MRVAEFYPEVTAPADGDRNVDELSSDEWGALIVSLADVRTAYEDAEGKATDAWTERFPR